MTEGEDSIQYFRRWGRRRYLTKHEQERRAKAKAEGARQIDVTLSAQALDDYATVQAYLNPETPGRAWRLQTYFLRSKRVRTASQRNSDCFLAAPANEERYADRKRFLPARFMAECVYRDVAPQNEIALP